MPGLTFSGALSILDTEITEVLTPTDDVELGSDLAYAPNFQGNARVRYQWALSNALDAYVMPQVTHSSSKYTDIIRINRLQLEGYTTFAMSAGIEADRWNVEIFGENLSDERAQIAGDFYYDRPRIVTNRPLTVGVRVGFNY